MSSTALVLNNEVFHLNKEILEVQKYINLLYGQLLWRGYSKSQVDELLTWKSTVYDQEIANPKKYLQIINQVNVEGARFSQKIFASIQTRYTPKAELVDTEDIGGFAIKQRRLRAIEAIV